MNVCKEFLRFVSAIVVYQSFTQVYAQDLNGRYIGIERKLITTGSLDRYSNWGGSRCYGGPKAPPFFVAKDNGAYKMAMPWEYGESWLCGTLNSQGRFDVRTRWNQQLTAIFDKDGQTIIGRIDFVNCGYEMKWQKDPSYNRKALAVIHRQCGGSDTPQTEVTPNRTR
jgi:hypothetical protein